MDGWRIKNILEQNISLKNCVALLFFKITFSSSAVILIWNDNRLHPGKQSYKATIAKANLVYKQKKKRNEAKQNTKAETV